MWWFAQFFLFTLSLAADCKFTVAGRTFDLTPIANKTITGHDIKVTTYQYWAKVCGDMTEKCDDIMTGKSINGAVYQFGGEPGGQHVCWDVLAFWDEGGLPTTSALDTNQAGVPDGTDGFTLGFSNGDECRNAPRITSLNMICRSGDDKLEGFQDSANSCHFVVNYYTEYACSGSPPKTTLPPGFWGVNGTYNGEITCNAGKDDCPFAPQLLQINGDCKEMKMVTQENGKFEVWDVQMEECNYYIFSGKLVNTLDTKMSMQFFGVVKTNGDVVIDTYDMDPPFMSRYTLDFKSQ